MNWCQKHLINFPAIIIIHQVRDDQGSVGLQATRCPKFFCAGLCSIALCIDTGLVFPYTSCYTCRDTTYQFFTTAVWPSHSALCMVYYSYQFVLYVQIPTVSPKPFHGFGIWLTTMFLDYYCWLQCSLLPQNTSLHSIAKKRKKIPFLQRRMICIVLLLLLLPCFDTGKVLYQIIFTLLIGKRLTK